VDALDLGGGWRAAEATEDLRRAFVDGRVDDSGWAPIEVPGHWRSTAAFATSDGPLLYRRRFEHERPADDRRVWLVLDGLAYQGDVWLDGTYLGDTEGYFAPHVFEITDELRDRTEHTLGVEVTCTPQGDDREKRNLTGSFQRWPGFDPSWNPGGIWRGVRIEETGPVRIRHLQVLCREASAERAVLACRAVLDTVDARTVVVRCTVAGEEVTFERPLAAGENRCEWAVTVPAPALWWPRALGGQPLHDVVVELLDERDERQEHAEPSHRRVLRTGLRHVRLRNWICSVNGERLFLKGSSVGPTRMALGEATSAQVRDDVERAVDAGLDLLRVHSHVARPELYDSADELGVLLWQDLPLHGGYARGVRKQAVRQAKAAVMLLGHHPSLAIWCGHDEPAPSTFVGQQLPTWNRSVLDRSVKRALEQADATRPVIAHSGVWPHLPGLDGTDTHLSFAAGGGDDVDVPALLASFPKLGRFVGAFGADAAPDGADVPEPERKAAQERQVALLKHVVETLRRLKYRPTGGFAQHFLADAAPGVTCSVLDHERRPKPGYHALVDACRPVIVVADRPPPSVRPGETVALDVHVVSDLRTSLTAIRCDAHLTWSGGEHRWRWEGDVEPDACVRVGTVRFVVPDAPGALRLELALAGPVEATNAYDSVVLR
jgi:beta-mannosidase